MTDDTVLVEITHKNDLVFGATTRDGHMLGIEPSKALGGSGMNPNPIDCMLAALGGCAGIKLLMTLSESGIQPASLRITIEGRRRSLPPEVFCNLHLTFFLKGELDENVVAAAMEKTMTLSCPVAVMIGRATELTWDFLVGMGSPPP